MDSDDPTDAKYGIGIADPFIEKPPILNSLDVADKKKKIDEVMKYINDKMNPKR